jgi:hypothetical protein
MKIVGHCIFATFVLSVTCSASHGGDSFNLKNTHGATATFHFHSYESGSTVVPPTPLTILPRDTRSVFLPSSNDHHLWFYSDGGARTDVGRINFRRELGGRQGLIIELVTLLGTERRSRDVRIQRMVPEARSRTISYIQLLPQTRSRLVTRIDPCTGRLVNVVERFTVMVPIQRQKIVNYVVEVPVTETVRQGYTVQVIKPLLRIVEDGGARQIIPNLTDPRNISPN